MKKFFVILSLALFFTGLIHLEVNAQGQGINFLVLENSQLRFKRVFLYGIPQREETPFFGEEFTVKVDGEIWTIQKDGLIVSPYGKTIIPAGATVEITSAEGLTFLPELTRPWADSLYDLFEVKRVSLPKPNFFLQKEEII